MTTVRQSVGSELTLEELETDPYPIYRRLRDVEPVSWVEAVNLWLITRDEDVRRIIDDPATFTPDTDPSTLNRTIGRTLMRSEGPHHRRIREVIEVPFRAKEVRRNTESLVRGIVADLIGELEQWGAVDLVQSFTEPLSVRTLSAVLGLDEIPEETLRRWFDAFALGGANFEADPDKQAHADRVSAEATEALGEVVSRLEQHPNGSALSSIIHARTDTGPLTLREIVSNVKLMILGGMQEPRDLIGLVLIALLTDPEQLSAVRDDPNLVRAAVDEGLRCFAPVGTLTRQTARTVNLAQTTLPPGAMVAAVIASANRDERRWTDPDRFDISRREGSHLAFGAGSHFCLGAALARWEGVIAIQALLERLPGLRLDPERPPLVRGWEFRGPVHLNLRWDQT